jgi:hypothetical protein
LTIDASFSIGTAIKLGWKATANVYVFIRTDSHHTTLTRVSKYRTFPFTVDAPANKSVSKNFFDDDSGNYDLAQSMAIDFGKPIFDPNEVEAAVCGSVALGPALALKAQWKDDISISAMARLDLPRVELCANLTRGLFTPVATTCIC